MDKSRLIPGSRRMCASLHRNSAIAAHGAHQPPGRAAFAAPFGDPPGQGRRNAVGFLRSGVDRGRPSKAVPPDQPRITIRARAPEPRPASISRLRFSRARAIPEKPGIGDRPTNPTPSSPGDQPHAMGKPPGDLWDPQPPFEGIHRISMTQSTMTTPNPAIPMARAHPFRGASPWPKQPRTGQGTRAMPVAPSCPLPRRTAGGPGRPAPTWEELLGQR